MGFGFMKVKYLYEGGLRQFTRLDTTYPTRLITKVTQVVTYIDAFDSLALSAVAIKAHHIKSVRTVSK